jgi:hypothetical protein
MGKDLPTGSPDRPPRPAPCIRSGTEWAYHQANTPAMNSLLYLIAVVLIIGWILGFFVYSASGLIHILLVLALVAILLRLIRGKEV